MAKTLPSQQAFVRLKSNTTGEWFVHPDLRPLLVEDAVEQGSNLTETALQILAERYGVVIDLNGRRTDPDPGDEVLNLRVPGRLARKIRDAQSREGRKSWIDQIRHDLQAHYGLEFVAEVA